MNVFARLRPRSWVSSWRSHVDTRTSMVILSATGAVPLLVIAMISPTFLRPNAFPLLIGVLLFTAVTVLFAARVGRLTEQQFAVLGFGGMAGVAVCAYLIADPAGMRAVTSMLAIVPAIAASGSPPRVTIALTAVSVAMATALSIEGMGSSGWAVTAVAIGAAATAVLVPVVLITGLRRALHVINEQLRVLASTDPLTGLVNRRGLLTLTEELLDTAARHDFPVSALVVDIDLFKTVNDTDGHAAGDRALTAVAQALVDAADDAGTPNAIVARIGGEEFLVLAPSRPGTNLADKVLHRVRSDCTVTVSVGALTVDLQQASPGTKPRPPRSSGTERDIDAVLDQVVRAADIALYAAKSAGRDHACHAGVLRIPWGADSVRGTRIRASADSRTATGERSRGDGSRRVS
ncbi:GGDEF domain-containing protein [Rhodococcus sp. Eu-32]|uniref:GGDEF domain-containing protein n=1 Tax=Rhodococcus sp. Eu-32 TaxID=1017319 RepID=UPI000DF3BD54|nr:GGDEF domain-containing protein [Rhodococcus sp. Eu-32]RRQ27244.1 GGDEF domain-containing protein [Rhodococcus sp. Eu-32]